jgi:hypothetical protein
MIDLIKTRNTGGIARRARRHAENSPTLIEPRRAIDMLAGGQRGMTKCS